jgi:ribonuclease E
LRHRSTASDHRGLCPGAVSVASAQAKGSHDKSKKPMANNKMLIDATHPEETRVVVLRQSRVEEFDYESAARKLLRGNIYLAKVTRVEPSLQAAFVDYGGNRHGFLAFNEIHPDYYQIPVADRRALLEAEAQAEAEEEAEADAAAERAQRRQQRRRRPEEGSERHGESDDVARTEDDEAAERDAVDVASYLPNAPEEVAAILEPAPSEEPPRATESDQPPPEREPSETIAAAAEADPKISETPASETSASPVEIEEANGGLSDVPHAIGLVEEIGVTEVETIETVENGSGAEPEQVESVGSEDALEELPSRPRRRQRSYKIQEVIKRRQVILVQVVKEERGTKGAALTTYLSLAGRYTVLMPNTGRGGGISRKITNPQDRKRLKAIADELDVPEGMGLIIRTAGAARTKQEIKRDFEYLLRLWESVRDLAISSNAPALVYEEGNLIKRSIRDLYGKEVDEIIVAGDEAHREAKEFMRMLMPSHAKNVIAYNEPEPLFNRFQIERQLNAMFSPYVYLRSGGYLVINQAEALVAIDVNSGKSTREFSIEETALQTNLEAADEIARQLKLRDLAGLIVIDFIDMEEKRNNRAVERRLKEALRFDRARIQVGRISHFGLLEMSRQRLRTGVLEGSTTQCPHCQGTGIIRSTESVALAVIRSIEDHLMQGTPTSLIANTTATVALYILNNKRQFIVDMENRYGVSILINASDKVQGANFTIERSQRREDAKPRPERTAVNMDWGFEGEGEDGEVEADEEAGGEVEAEAGAGQPRDEGENGGSGGRRRRRRRRRGRRDERAAEMRQPEGGGQEAAGDQAYDEAAFEPYEASGEPDNMVAEETARDEGLEERERRAHGGNGHDGGQRRGRRRGRRGGRRGGGDREGARDTSLSAGGERERQPAEGYVTRHGVESEPRVVPIREGAETGAAVEAEVARSEPIGTHEPFDVTEARGEPREERPAAPSCATEAPVVAHEPEPAHVAAHAEAAKSDTGNGGSAAQRQSRSQPVASEPVLERVVVRPEGASSEPVPAGEDARPARRGWWQRRLLG